MERPVSDDDSSKINQSATLKNYFDGGLLIAKEMAGLESLGELYLITS